MPLPSLLLAFLVASLYGLVFYLFFGRGWIALVVYWLAGLAGFAIGQLLTSVIGMGLLPIGSLNVLEASVVSLILLLVTRTVYRHLV